jgi:hypothetical protein
MSALSISVPYPVFSGKDGLPLDNGYVWIGTANLYPITNPIAVYFDEALTIQATQPLRTINGFISNAGTPAQVYVDAVNFSILVQDSKGTMVYNFPDGTGISPNAAGVVYDPPFTGSVATNVEVKLAQTVSVLDFGAVGDGTTDNYVALKAAADYITAAGGGTLYFPPGDYYIDRFVTASNGVVDPMQFSGCTGLALLGYGAKITTKGNYNRDAVTTRSLSVLVLTNCKNVTIEGFEIDGQLNLTTTSAAYAEPISYGVYLLSCINVTLKNLDIHHVMTDGVYMRDDGIQTNPRVACKYITGTNVSSTYCGRQGMSIVQARWVTFIDSNFSYTFRDSVVGFSPSAGVDIEPNRSTATPSPNQMDVDTGQCTFIGCRFEENAGSQFIAFSGNIVKNVALENCSLIVGSGSFGGSDCMVFESDLISVNNCYFNLGTNKRIFVYFTYTVSNGATFTNNLFEMPYLNRIVFTNVVPVLFQNNRVIVTGTIPWPGTQQIISSLNTELVAENNYFYVPKEIYIDGGTGDRMIMFLSNGKRFKGNTYETDLLAAAGDTGTANYAQSYGTSTVAQDEVFIGTAPGTADTFRPVFNGDFNTNLPYNKSLPGYAEVTYNPPSLITGTSTTTTVTVTGAAIGDFTLASFQRDLLGVTLFAWVSAADTVSVQFRNDTGGTIDLASGSLRVQVTAVPR